MTFLKSSENGRNLISRYAKNSVLSPVDRKSLIKLILENIKNEPVTPAIFQKIDSQILINFPSEEQVRFKKNSYFLKTEAS